MLTAILLAQALAAPPIGIVLAVDDPGARLVLRQALEEALRPMPVLWSCRAATLCLEVAAVPIAAGKTSSGWAVAARMARRLAASPQWPGGVPRPGQEPREAGPVVEIIEDTTASGELACVPCEEERATLRQALEAFREFAGSRFEEVGGLGLWVGPAQESFLRQVATNAASELRKWAGGNEP